MFWVSLTKIDGDSFPDSPTPVLLDLSKAYMVKPHFEGGTFICFQSEFLSFDTSVVWVRETVGEIMMKKGKAIFGEPSRRAAVPLSTGNQI